MSGAKKVLEAKTSIDEPVHARIIELNRGFPTKVMFETDEGARAFLPVPENIASHLVVGDAGFLTYHKEVFKKREKD